MARQKGEHTEEQIWDHHATEPTDAWEHHTGRWTSSSPVPRRIGARTPEELEALLEDGLLMREREALTALFDESAVLIVDHAPPARGHAEIGRVALEVWGDDRPYLADPRRVVQARDIALVVTEHGINVARRRRDGTWRYTIVFVSGDTASKGAHT